MRKKLILIGLLCIPLLNYAQVFNLAGTPIDRYGVSSTLPGPNVKAIGIGNFTTFPKAALHIDANLLTPPTNQTTMFNRGEVFRTDCPTANTSYWKMMRGGSEKLWLSSPVLSAAGGGNDVVIENRQKGAMLFGTGLINRMIILDCTGADLLTGFVGIGNNFFAPKSQLHVSDGANDTYMQVTNNFTGATATDGFRFGLLSTGEVLLNQQEDKPMWFFTNNTLRMAIDNKGTVTINSLASCSNMLVTADCNGTLKITTIEVIITQSKIIAQLQNRLSELENKMNNLTAQNENKINLKYFTKTFVVVQ